MNRTNPPWTDGPSPDRASWLHTVEVTLTADERAYLRDRVAKMSPHQFERVSQLTRDEAVRHLRLEMPRSLTTRKIT